MQQSKPLTLSAFGQFGNIKHNPSSIILQMLTEEDKKSLNIIKTEVVEVSTVGCDEYIKSLPEGSFNIHLGVYDGSQEFHLEQFSYNCKDFGIPDMRGYQVSQKEIDENHKLDAPLECQIDLEAILKRLYYNHKVIISNDPGRYICNYMYFCSQKNTGNSLFVHVPAFRQISQADQYKFLIDLLKTINDYLNKRV